MAVTMEAMEALMAKMMSGVAKSEELQSIGISLKKCEVKVDDVASRVDKHSSELSTLRDEVERLKNGAGVTERAPAHPWTGTESPRSGSEWHPRIIMVRG